MATGLKCPNRKCPSHRTGKHRVWKKGVVPTRTGQRQRFVCFVCGKTFYSPNVPKVKTKFRKEVR